MLPKYDENKLMFKLKNKLEQIRLGTDAGYAQLELYY